MDIMNGFPNGGFPGTDGLLGPFLQEADAYLRTQIDPDTYQRIMGYEAGRARPYVAARILLGNDQWNRYLWISHHGTLAGFPE